MCGKIMNPAVLYPLPSHSSHIAVNRLLIDPAVSKVLPSLAVPRSFPAFHKSKALTTAHTEFVNIKCTKIFLRPSFWIQCRCLFDLDIFLLTLLVTLWDFELWIMNVLISEWSYIMPNLTVIYLIYYVTYYVVSYCR